MFRILKRLFPSKPNPDDRSANNYTPAPSSLEEPPEVIAAELERQRRDQEAAKIEKAKRRYEEDVEKRKATVLGSHTGLMRIYRRAESVIGKANEEFEARAFAPFWDFIEQAVELLAKSKSQSETVSQDFHKLASVVKSPPTTTSVLEFPVQEILIPDFKGLVVELRATVRKAQTDFEFSTIYEQRRGNRILIEGFSTLGNAIESMESRLAGEIGRLNREIQDGLEAIQTAQREAAHMMSESIADLAHSTASAALGITHAVGEVREAITEKNEESTTHEERIEEMLDNIQRRRKPL
jgi:hypothetical protein